MAVYDPYSEQIVGLRQQQALAQKLRESAQTPSQGQMVSGWYVKPNALGEMAKALNFYTGLTKESEAEKKIKDIGEERKLAHEAFVSSMPKAQEVQVEDRSGMKPTEVGPSPLSKALRVKPTTEEMLGWAATAPGLDTGTIAQLGVKGAELEAARQARVEEAKIKAAADLQRERERGQERQDLARLTASLRPTPQEKPLTEFQGKSVMFGTRAADAHNTLNALETDVNPLAVAASSKGGALVNWALAPETRRVEQAQRNFINAVLRQESGAAISSGEFESAKRQYFPEAGDPPEVIAQKRAARELVIKGFARQAGSGAADIAEVYNAATPALPKTPTATPSNSQIKMPDQNAIAAEMAKRAAAATNQGRP